MQAILKTTEKYALQRRALSKKYKELLRKQEEHEHLARGAWAAAHAGWHPSHVQMALDGQSHAAPSDAVALSAIRRELLSVEVGLSSYHDITSASSYSTTIELALAISWRRLAHKNMTPCGSCRVTWTASMYIWLSTSAAWTSMNTSLWHYTGCSTHRPPSRAACGRLVNLPPAEQKMLCFSPEVVMLCRNVMFITLCAKQSTHRNIQPNQCLNH